MDNLERVDQLDLDSLDDLPFTQEPVQPDVEDDEEEVFFGSVTEKEKRKSRKYDRRRTLAFKSGFRRDPKLMRYTMDRLRISTYQQGIISEEPFEEEGDQEEQFLDSLMEPPVTESSEDNRENIEPSENMDTDKLTKIHNIGILKEMTNGENIDSSGDHCGMMIQNGGKCEATMTKDEEKVEVQNHFVNGDISVELYDSLMEEGDQKAGDSINMSKDSLDRTELKTLDFTQDSLDCEDSLTGVKSEDVEVKVGDSECEIVTDERSMLVDEVISCNQECGVDTGRGKECVNEVKIDADQSDCCVLNGNENDKDCGLDVIDVKISEMNELNGDIVQKGLLDVDKDLEDEITESIENEKISDVRGLDSDVDSENIEAELAIQNVQLQVSIADESICEMSDALTKSFSLQCSMVDDSINDSVENVKCKDIDSLKSREDAESKSFSIQCSMIEDSLDMSSELCETPTNLQNSEKEDNFTMDSLNTSLPKMVITTPAKLHSESFGAFSSYHSAVLESLDNSENNKTSKDVVTPDSQEVQSICSQDSGLPCSALPSGSSNSPIDRQLSSGASTSSDVFSVATDLDEEIAASNRFLAEPQGIVFKEQNYSELSPKLLSSASPLTVEKSLSKSQSRIVFRETQFSPAKHLEKPNTNRSNSPMCGIDVCDRCSPSKCRVDAGQPLTCSPVRDAHVPQHVSPGSAWDEWSRSHNDSIQQSDDIDDVTASQSECVLPEMRKNFRKPERRGMRRSVSTPSVPVATLVETSTFKLRKSKLKTVESTFAPTSINELTKPPKSAEPSVRSRPFCSPGRVALPPRYKLPNSSPAPFANRATQHAARISSYTTKKPTYARVPQTPPKRTPHSTPVRVPSSPLSGSRQRLNSVGKTGRSALKKSPKKSGATSSQKSNATPSSPNVKPQLLMSNKLRQTASPKVDSWRIGPKARANLIESPQSSRSPTPGSSRGETPTREGSNSVPMKRSASKPHLFRRGTPKFPSPLLVRSPLNSAMPLPKFTLDESPARLDDKGLEEKKEQLRLLREEKRRLQQKLGIKPTTSSSSSSPPASPQTADVSPKIPRVNYKDTNALILKDRELEAVTMVHTLCNSHQMTKIIKKPTAVQAKHPPVYVVKDPSLLQWSEQLAVDTAMLPSSPPQPVPVSKPILRTSLGSFPYQDEPPSSIVLRKCSKSQQSMALAATRAAKEQLLKSGEN